jgi:hypothetical protein
MHEAAKVVKVDRDQVVELMGCGWDDIRAKIRSGDRDPQSGAVVHNSVLAEFENGARLVHSKGTEGREFRIMPRSINGDEARQIEEMLAAGQLPKVKVPVRNGGTA